MAAENRTQTGIRRMQPDVREVATAVRTVKGLRLPKSQQNREQNALNKGPETQDSQQLQHKNEVNAGTTKQSGCQGPKGAGNHGAPHLLKHQVEEMADAGWSETQQGVRGHQHEQEKDRTSQVT